MVDPVYYGDWRVAPDFATAVHAATGDQIAFTRAERALLGVLTHNANTVLHRERLLDAIAGDKSEVSDRNVDFTINRLRRKLQDSATKPRYIATQYGEGYLWVAQRVETQRPSAGAFIVVGPVRGSQFSGHLAEAGWAFIRRLIRALDRDTAQRHTVALDLDCPAAEHFEGDLPRFAVQLNFFKAAEQRLDCAVTLKRFAAGVVVSINRFRINDPDPEAPSDAVIATRRARDVLRDIRRSLTYTEDAAATPDDEPLAIRQQQAAVLLAKSRPQWDKTVRRLEARVHERPNDQETAAMLSAARYRMATAANQAAEREYRLALHDDPHNPTNQLLLATALHFKYVAAGREILAGPARQNYPQDEAEIEELVMSALPSLQSNGIFALTAAKLLYFVNKAHSPLALELAAGALQTTTAFATAFTTVGQLYAWEARSDEALAFYAQARELAADAADFRLYIQTLQCQALSAISDHDAVAVVATDMYRSEPRCRAQLCLFYGATDAFDLTPTLDYTLGGLDVNSARGNLRYLHYLSARHSSRKTHRPNILRRPLALLVDRFGEDCIPDEVRPDMPDTLISKTG
jgi:hypothetical protein